MVAKHLSLIDPIILAPDFSAGIRYPAQTLFELRNASNPAGWDCA